MGRFGIPSIKMGKQTPLLINQPMEKGHLGSKEEYH